MSARDVKLTLVRTRSPCARSSCTLLQSPVRACPLGCRAISATSELSISLGPGLVLARSTSAAYKRSRSLAFSLLRTLAAFAAILAAFLVQRLFAARLSLPTASSLVARTMATSASPSAVDLRLRPSAERGHAGACSRSCAPLTLVQITTGSRRTTQADGSIRALADLRRHSPSPRTTTRRTCSSAVCTSHLRRRKLTSQSRHQRGPRRGARFVDELSH